MNHQVVRASLVIIMLVVVAASCYRLLLTERQIESARDAQQTFIDLTWKLDLSLADLRAAQQAYIAAGQDHAYWFARVSSTLGDATSELDDLARSAMAAGAVDALGNARSAVERLERLDQLVRDHATAGQDLMASDLIFTDGAELASQTASQIEVARVSERRAHERLRQRRRNDQAIALAAGMGTGLLVAFFLLPVKWRERVTLAAAPSGVGETAETAADTTVIQPAETPLLERDDHADRLSSDTVAPIGSASDTATHDLRLAAALCTDLSRLTDLDDLPGVLERATSLLHAAGLIIWVRDGSGNALRPVAGHGYSPDTLSRMGPISCDGDNAAATAYRRAELGVVSGSAESLGAVVAPLLSPTRCVGVMSAEIHEGWETNETIQATASILAAQLATLVTAEPLDHAERAQG